MFVHPELYQSETETEKSICGSRCVSVAAEAFIRVVAASIIRAGNKALAAELKWLNPVQVWFNLTFTWFEPVPSTI